MWVCAGCGGGRCETGAKSAVQAVAEVGAAGGCDSQWRDAIGWAPASVGRHEGAIPWERA